MSGQNQLAKSTIKIVHHETDICSLIDVIINRTFEVDKTYARLELDAYREMMLSVQMALNDQRCNRKIVDSIKKDLIEYLETDQFLIQSNLYFRASRPRQQPGQENIDWHRESFYGPNLSKVVNVWTPIRDVSGANSLQYIPESQLIPDRLIIREKMGSTHTKRFSTGHRLGFNYDPKVITGGVDFTNTKRLIVSPGASALFSGNLIHGAATNLSPKIRFSVDFQVIRKKDYSTKNKKAHFSSGLEYFIEM
tara:strand:- start:18372 stop:19124 length:753 start_codon:yes stop_codon:yes gene_type:complete